MLAEKAQKAKQFIPGVGHYQNVEKALDNFITKGAAKGWK